jgi:hypothetical protein
MSLFLSHLYSKFGYTTDDCIYFVFQTTRVCVIQYNVYMDAVQVRQVLSVFVLRGNNPVNHTVLVWNA